MADTEIATMSAAVDAAIQRSGRPDRRADIISYLRQTLREIQSLAYFERDLIEDQLTANADPYTWDVPNGFRMMRTVEYPGLFDPQGHTVYPRYMPPGRHLRGHDVYYYRSGDYYVFAGHGASSGSTTSINIAYYRYALPLAYYATVADRPARYFLETESWTYATASTDDEKETARNQVTNWLLFHWYDTVIEGALAKVFKAIGDERAVSTFALYKSLQNTLLQGESKAAMGGEI